MYKYLLALHLSLYLFVSSSSHANVNLIRNFEPSNKVALVVGVNKYGSGGFTHLKYAVNDATVLGSTFRKKGYRVSSLKDNSVTKLSILSEIKNSAKLLQKNDLFVFSYSGHAVSINGKNYLIPSNTTLTYGSNHNDLAKQSVSVTEIVQQIKKSGIKRAVLFLDACRNNPLTGSKGLKVIAKSNNEGGFVDKNFGEGIQILYSTSHGGISFESPKFNQGVFSYFLSKGLLGEASDTEGNVTFDNLARYVERRVMDWSRQSVFATQRPFRSSFGEYKTSLILTKNKILKEPKTNQNHHLSPKIRLLSKRVSKVNQPRYDLKVLLTDTGGGIGNVQYRLNGKIVDNYSARPLAPREPAGQKSYIRPFNLTDGQNVIEILASDASDTALSKPTRVHVWLDRKAQLAPSLYVLSIGVTKYDDPDFNLKYAANDANNIARAFESQKGKLFRNIDLKVLENESATLANIKSEISRISSVANTNDVFLLFMAGHGMVVKDDYHFIPFDVIYENHRSITNGGFSENKMKEWLSEIKTNKKIMILDTCYSGKAVPLITALNETSSENFVLRTPIAEKKAISDLMDATGFSIFSSAATREQAAAGIVKKGEPGQGVFTHVFIEGLLGKANIITEDEFIDMDELYAYVRREVPILSNKLWSRKQRPMLYIAENYPIARIK